MNLKAFFARLFGKKSSSKWEPLTTPEAIRMAMAAGRQVEYTGWLDDGYDMPAWNEPCSGGWIPCECDAAFDRLLDGGRFRARREATPA
jgi:hypothetical protein